MWRGHRDAHEPELPLGPLQQEHQVLTGIGREQEASCHVPGWEVTVGMTAKALLQEILQQLHEEAKQPKSKI